eukprot:9070864-Lingulodinium_polyedra.AAC.1
MALLRAPSRHGTPEVFAGTGDGTLAALRLGASCGQYISFGFVMCGCSLRLHPCRCAACCPFSAIKRCCVRCMRAVQ